MAVGDQQTCLAHPLTTLSCKGIPQDYHAILDLARSNEAECIVVGIPISLDGSLGPQGRRVKAFVRDLRAICPIPVATWDERLTSVEADRRLREAGVQGSRLKGRRDAVAAALLLQAYLDSRRIAGE